MIRTPITSQLSIPSGSISLDRILGGGYPCGRMTMIAGPEKCGKTTLALHAIASCQKEGKIAAYVDLDCSFDVKYAERLGINAAELILVKPGSGEDVFDICHKLLSINSLGLLVFDSIASISTKKEIDGNLIDDLPFVQSTFVTTEVKKLARIVSKNTSIIFTNQVRERLENPGPGFSKPCGWIIRFYSSVILELDRSGVIRRREIPVGYNLHAKVTKTRVSTPLLETSIEIINGSGICIAADLLDNAIANGLVTISGSWYYWQNDILGHGREKAIIQLEKNKYSADALRKELFKLVVNPCNISRRTTLGKTLA